MYVGRQKIPQIPMYNIRLKGQMVKDNTFIKMLKYLLSYSKQAVTKTLKLEMESLTFSFMLSHNKKFQRCKHKKYYLKPI